MQTISALGFCLAECDTAGRVIPAFVAAISYVGWRRVSHACVVAFDSVARIINIVNGLSITCLEREGSRRHRFRSCRNIAVLAQLC
jgi:hypothetical protein